MGLLIKDVFSQVRDGKMILSFDALRFHLLRKPFFTLCATTTFSKQQGNIIVLTCSGVKVFTYFIKLSHFENINTQTHKHTNTMIHIAMIFRITLLE